MEKDEFVKIIIEKSRLISAELNEKQAEKFFKYMRLLTEWNEKINLTAIIEPKEVIQKHFIDSLTISKFIETNSKIIDVGTGAGFPGVPIKIFRDDVEMVLLDSLNKRINFLNEIISEINLDKINTVHNRVEEFGKNIKYREKFDVATSRAVANLSTLAEYMIPLVKVNGKCICMKSSGIDEEIENSKNAIKELGGKIEKIIEFELPESDIKRSLIIIRKIKNTPSKYPRKAGTPSKEPIK